MGKGNTHLLLQLTVAGCGGLLRKGTWPKRGVLTRRNSAPTFARKCQVQDALHVGRCAAAKGNVTHQVMDVPLQPHKNLFQSAKVVENQGMETYRLVTNVALLAQGALAT